MVLAWLKKYGTLDWSKPNSRIIPKNKETPAQRIKPLEGELEDEKLRNDILNTMINLSDKQIRNNYSPKPSSTSDSNKE